ncbi:Hsp20/alpha crystallin family protein [Nitrosococcus wardiae]|uniref:Hsp20/alpha crystallin family protein n=1 Tax=Nitrosococcus wardiae TaxID=1814290 RepID=A0A4P7C541_9GAMM|nr:Hsp20/alpha crystallin family protein [Nitrosococcus wardiae]QBQ56096.1 Hsp20/alpha crystallin family protein [Nitrosococcus wardiae]
MFGNRANFEAGLFNEFRRLEQEMDQLFGATPWPSGIRAVERGTYPPINVGSTPDQVDVYLFAAGLDPKSLDISIQQNLLTVAGERKLSTEEGVNYYRKERFDGTFRRVVTLPEDVDPDQVSARYRDGVLHVTIQRRESAKPRQIEVK